MECLITGATGFVGGHIVRRALADGHTCRAIVRPTSQTDELEQAGVDCRVGSLGDAAFVREALDGVDWFFHCAGKVGDWGRWADFHEANVVPLPGILTAAQDAGVQRMLFLSSLGVYPLGHHRGTDESVPPKKSGDGYWDSKIDSERLVTEAYERSGLAVTVIRPGYIFGPGDNHVLPRLLTNLKAGRVKYLGTGDQALSPIYIGNLIDIIFLALSKPEAAGQIYNVREVPRISKKQFIDKVADLVGYPAPTKHVPMGVAVVVAHLLHNTGKLLHLAKAPLLSKNRLKFMGMDLDYSCEKVRRELGWEPRHQWEEALAETLAWFRDQGRLPDA